VIVVVVAVPSQQQQKKLAIVVSNPRAATSVHTKILQSPEIKELKYSFLLCWNVLLT